MNGRKMVEKRKKEEERKGERKGSGDQSAPQEANFWQFPVSFGTHSTFGCFAWTAPAFILHPVTWGGTWEAFKRDRSPFQATEILSKMI